MQKLDTYHDVIARLVSETVACSPKSWSCGTLTIDCDGIRIDYKLKNGDQPESAIISDDLRSMCEELYVTMSTHGDQWTQATIRFEVNGDDVTFKNSFQCANRSL